MSKSSRRTKTVLAVCVLTLVLSLFASPSHARVSWVEITETSDFAGGMSFGKVGPYVKIKGKLTYAVDPDNVLIGKLWT